MSPGPTRFRTVWESDTDRTGLSLRTQTKISYQKAYGSQIEPKKFGNRHGGDLNALETDSFKGLLVTARAGLLTAKETPLR